MNTAGSRIGFGLRSVHYPDFLDGAEAPSVVEVIAENFIGRGGRPRKVLETVRRDVELVVHGVSLSLGGTDPIDRAHLDGLAELVRDLAPTVVSDHLCFSKAHGTYAHDLWPLPLTEATTRRLVERIDLVQGVLGRRIAIENVSRYVGYQEDEMSEWDFINQVARRADCEILLDTNNAYVSAHNLDFSATSFIDEIDYRRVAQVHVAGHSDQAGYLFDDHASRVSRDVLALTRRFVDRGSACPIIIEWDENVPSLAGLFDEIRRVEAALQDDVTEVTHAAA